MYWFLYDATGNIKEAQIVNVTEWANLNGYAGAASFELSDATAQDAFNNPSYYTVQSGQLVQVATIATLQLQDAQTKQIAQINAGYAGTIAQGFQCAIGTTTYTFGWQQEDQIHLGQVQQAIDKGIDTFPVAYADINGNPVSIPDQTTLTALDTKANSFAWAQVKQRRTLIGNIKAATTVSAVQSVTWSPATY